MDHNSPSNHSNIITIILNTKEAKDQSQNTNTNSANTHTNTNSTNIPNHKTWRGMCDTSGSRDARRKEITTTRREEITTTITITLSPSLSESAREAIFCTLDSAIGEREQIYWHVGSGLRRFWGSP